jgi:hypothetical protein
LQHSDSASSLYSGGARIAIDTLDSNDMASSFWVCPVLADASIAQPFCNVAPMSSNNSLEPTLEANAIPLRVGSGAAQLNR